MLKRLIYFLIAGSLLVSCAEDLGNYDYHDLTEPEISGIEENLSALTFSRLQLSPDLGVHEFPESNYSFEWRALSESDDLTVTVLGTSRNLDYEVALLPGSYKLLFKMTENSSGVFWQTSYNLQVSEPTSEGWMVLCADGSANRARLDVISAITGETLQDVLRNNGMPAMNGPRRILWSAYADSDSPFYLLTNDGATRLGRNGFEWKEEFRMKYEMGITADPIPETIIDGVTAKLMISESRAYYSTYGGGIAGLFGSISNTLNVAPVIGSNISTDAIMVPAYLLYDLDNKCFMGYAPDLASPDVGNYPPLNEMNELVMVLSKMDNGGKVLGTAFDQFPTGLDFVHMENTKYDPNNTKMGIVYTVLRSGNRFYLYGTQLGEMWGAVTIGDCAYALGKTYYGDLSACTNIAQAQKFAFSSLKNLMYYAVGGTVYRVDLSATPLQATRQFTLAGEQITCLKFNFYDQGRNLTRSYDLVVGSVKDNAGTLRIYEGFNSDGDFQIVAPQTYTGLGRIVDVSYREMLK